MRPSPTRVSGLSSSRRAALIYQHSDEERQRDLAAGLDDMVRVAKHYKGKDHEPADHNE
ncbi:hypothetical protein ACKI10_01270 [Streptomyces galilaeus]|uniref:Uncharacterized protein n=1 Tax=Streptomyces galilaeus TaxID=33899 RepID=A0ABW9ID20_STRGJ